MTTRTTTGEIGIVATPADDAYFVFGRLILVDEVENKAVEIGDAERAAAELLDARQIIADLARIKDRLSVSDRRFLLSWQQYLDRCGDAAVVGKYRLTILRRVLATYEVARSADA